MFSVNYKDPRPVYEQVKDNLRLAILTGALAPDDRIPSVREAAATLVINPNTIQKAYRELEMEGYIYSVPGRGSFVADSTRARAERTAELFKALDGAVTQLKNIGISADEICRHIEDGGAKENGDG